VQQTLENGGYMSSRPNILLLFTDEQRFDTIAAGGYGHMVTPNLDRLVREGCYFTHAHTPNPVSISARCNLITGLPARYHGLPNNGTKPFSHTIPTLPRLLSDNGYQTRAIGKMHFLPVRRHHGFQKLELMEELCTWREDDEYATYLKNVGLGNIIHLHGVRNLLYFLPQQSIIPEEHHGSKWVADRSIDFIKNHHGKGRPFFLWSSWIAPHPPFDVPESFAHLYDDRDIPEPLQSKTSVSNNVLDNQTLADLPTPAYVKRARQSYFGAISHVDQQIGRVLDALEQTGEMDNTIIIFASDHGDMMGDYGCYAKMVPYDGSARIPMIIRYPKAFAPGSKRSDFVDLNDILPTCLDAAGLEYPGPETLPGESLLKTGGTKDRAYQYVEHASGKKRWISLRSRRFKYNFYFGGGREELFDMESPDGEAVNLLEVRASEFEEVRKQHHDKLYEYEHRWGLEKCTADGEFVKLEPFEPGRGRNAQFPNHYRRFVGSDDEKTYNRFVDEVLEAIKNEPGVRLRDLDLEPWWAKALEKGWVRPEHFEDLKKSPNW
jgi:arylsulfatase